MPVFLAPLHEFNPCHSPDNGEFCSTGAGDSQAKSTAYVEKLWAMGYPNPINDRETIIDNEILIEAWPLEDSVYLTGLRAVAHGKGAGTRVMTRLVQLADEMGVTLTLSPRPLEVPRGQKKIPAKKLVEFYKRFGFTGSGRTEMRRRPQGA
jgi:GNAT superfamily N-acetyltransferase